MLVRNDGPGFAADRSAVRSAAPQELTTEVMRMPGPLSLETAGNVHSVAVLLVAHGDVKLTVCARRQFFFASQQAPRQAEVHELDKNRPNKEPSFHLVILSSS